MNNDLQAASTAPTILSNYQPCPSTSHPFLFDFDEFPVRVVDGEDGQVWFVAADVCRVLGIENARNVVARLDDDEKAVHTMDTLGGIQNLNTISESGVFALLFTSRKPEAKRFRKWVTSEVLPAIRRTGRYGLPQPEAVPLPAMEAFQTSLLDLASKVDLLAAKVATLPARKVQQTVIYKDGDTGKGIAILSWLARQISLIPPAQRFPYKTTDGFLVLPLKGVMAFLAQHRSCPFKIYSTFHLANLLNRDKLLAERNASRSIDGKKHKCAVIPLVRMAETEIAWPDQGWPRRGGRGNNTSWA